MCVITGTKGSTPLKTGAKMVVTAGGNIFGTIGGGDLEKCVIENAIEVIRVGQSQRFSHNLLQQHGMCCGGTAEVFIDFIRSPDRLYIFGSGHVGRALADLAVKVPFEVYVIDDRPEELKKITHADINKLPVQYHEIIPALPFNKNTFIAVMTRNHSMDREILAACLHKNYAYLGMIGSKRKVEITRKMFMNGGICTEDEFLAVDSPMGIHIHAQSPAEIAVSIVARLIEVKNKPAGIPEKEVLSELNKKL